MIKSLIPHHIWWLYRNESASGTW